MFNSTLISSANQNGLANVNNLEISVEMFFYLITYLHNNSTVSQSREFQNDQRESRGNISNRHSPKEW